jgi:two-component system sensor histidine kinase/response regulator
MQGTGDILHGIDGNVIRKTDRSWKGTRHSRPAAAWSEIEEKCGHLRYRPNEFEHQVRFGPDLEVEETGFHGGGSLMNSDLEKSVERASVLIVDDVSKNIQVLGSILRDEGYKISFALNGKDALKKVEASPPDLILLDVMMPEMDGYETCRRLRENESTIDIPVIFLTAKSDEESRIKGFEVGAQDYVTKPFNTPELLARVNTHLQLKKVRDEMIFVNKQLRQENILRESILKELERSNKKLKESDDIKNEFISILSHDMGTPITVIKANLEMVEEIYFVSLDDNLKRILKSMERASEALERLRKDTLDLSRMDMGTMKMDVEEFDLGDLIMESVEGIRGPAAKKKQSVYVESEGPLPVKADRFKIRRVLTNFLSNAQRYSPEERNFGVIAENNNGEIIVEIRDTGRGIDPDELERIFERFYRTGKRVEGSTGLGLAIVKGIIEAHGGRTWAESKGEGHGSSFFFTLPSVN